MAVCLPRIPPGPRSVLGALRFRFPVALRACSLVSCCVPGPPPAVSVALVWGSEHRVHVCGGRCGPALFSRAEQPSGASARGHTRVSPSRCCAWGHRPCAVSRPVTGTVLEASDPECEPAAAHCKQGHHCARWPGGHSRWPNTWAACLPAGLAPNLLCSLRAAPGGGRQAAGLALGWSWQGGAPFWPPLHASPRVHCAEAWDGLPLLAERHGGEAGQDRSAWGLLRSPSRGYPHYPKAEQGGGPGVGQRVPRPRTLTTQHRPPQRTDSRGPPMSLDLVGLGPAQAPQGRLKEPRWG